MSVHSNKVCMFVFDSFCELVDQFIYVGTIISSTESYVNRYIDSLLLTGCQIFPSSNHVSTTVWLNCLEKKLDQNYTKIMEITAYKTAVVWPFISHLANHPRKARHAGHDWWSKDQLISIVLLWTSLHGHTSVGRSTQTYIHQFF